MHACPVHVHALCVHVHDLHKHSALKRCIQFEHDLQAMHTTGSKDILFWCDRNSQDNEENKINNDEEEGNEDVSAITKRTKSASAEERSLKMEFTSCTHSMLMSMTMANTNCGQGRSGIISGKILIIPQMCR